MLYLAAFWILIVLFFLFYGLARWQHWKQALSLIEQYGILFFIAAVSLVLVAMATKDPVSLLGITVPDQIQWLGSLFIAGFGAWKFYLNPLKSKVYVLDREMGEVRTSVKLLDRETREMKTSVRRIEKDIDKVGDKLDLILRSKSI